MHESLCWPTPLTLQELQERTAAEAAQAAAQVAALRSQLEDLQTAQESAMDAARAEQGRMMDALQVCVTGCICGSAAAATQGGEHIDTIHTHAHSLSIYGIYTVYTQAAHNTGSRACTHKYTLHTVIHVT